MVHTLFTYLVTPDQEKWGLLVANENLTFGPSHVPGVRIVEYPRASSNTS